nr:uncharacterized protein LOC109179062 [Ipomoea batatas]
MGEMLGRSNLIDDIDLNALIVEDYIECNLPNGVESDSLVVCNASSSCFDGDHDDIPDGCNPSAGVGGTSTYANADDSSIPGFSEERSSLKCFGDILVCMIQEYFYDSSVFIQLTYLDRLEFKGNKIQRISPAVTSWTEEKVRERIKSEVKSGQFGRGKVIPRFEREEERVHERIDENVQAELSDESLKKVTSVLRKMADTVVEFGEVMAEIGNNKTGGGIIKRTFENIAEMINGVSSSQPPQQQGLLDDDDIFNQPSFLDAVSALEQAFLQTRKNYAAQPEQPTTSQSQHHIQTPSFDLGVPSPQPAAMEQPQNKIDSTELRNIARDLDEDSEKTISDEQQLDTTPEDNTMKQLFDSEQLFEYAGYYLDRETFQSMRAGELESVIVDVWCLRLNQLDLNKGLDKPKRIFFSTQAFIQLDSPTNWEKGENADQSSY